MLTALRPQQFMYKFVNRILQQHLTLHVSNYATTPVSRKLTQSHCGHSFLLREKRLSHFGLFARGVSIKSASGSSFTWASPTFRGYLESLAAEFHQGKDLLLVTTEEGHRSHAEATRRRIHELTPVVNHVDYLKVKVQELEELDQLISEEADPNMIEMANLDRLKCLSEIEDTEMYLVEILIPIELLDQNDIILECTAGVGGQEAMLFTEEMYNMYKQYALFKGWAFTELAFDETDIGGLKNGTASITGVDVYKHLKYEGGVHRVQRVPKTEKGARVHTSTMSVAVMPQPTDIDIQLDPKDLRIDAFRSSGAGGQHVNTTDSAVRVTHLPTKMVAECQAGRSQIANKSAALNLLSTKLYKRELEQKRSSETRQRKIQVGTSGRSEKIRTYNYQQDRITDHRLRDNLHNVRSFLTGGEQLDSLVNSLQVAASHERFEELLAQFEKKRKISEKL